MQSAFHNPQRVSTATEYQSDREFSKRELAILAEQSRREEIATIAKETTDKRKAALEPLDVVAGMQSISTEAATVLRAHLLAGNVDIVGTMTRSLIDLYIEQDSEVMANDRMDRIDAEVAKWGVQ
jgi:hypothetical protein